MTTNTRLKQLMSEKTAPRNRNEKEIAGYRDALNVVHLFGLEMPESEEGINELGKKISEFTLAALDGLKNH